MMRKSVAGNEARDRDTETEKVGRVRFSQSARETATDRERERETEIEGQLRGPETREKSAVIVLSVERVTRRGFAASCQ